MEREDGGVGVERVGLLPFLLRQGNAATGVGQLEEQPARSGGVQAAAWGCWCVAAAVCEPSWGNRCNCGWLSTLLGTCLWYMSLGGKTETI